MCIDYFQGLLNDSAELKIKLTKINIYASLSVFYII